LYRVLCIAFLNKLLIFFKAYYQESYILIIEYSSVVTLAEWLDGSFESQSRLGKAQQRFDTRKSQIMLNTLLSLKQQKVKVYIFKNKRINYKFLKIIHCSKNSVTSEKCIMTRYMIFTLSQKWVKLLKYSGLYHRPPISGLYHRPL
jgi:hypothetical protein